MASMPLVVAYPLMKRLIDLPQLWLGMVFNWGALVGWTAVKGGMDIALIGPLYASGICWTLIYDTIYAHQDKIDDVKAGVKSSALYFGDNTKQYLSMIGAGMVGSLTFTGYLSGLGLPYYLITVLGSGAHIGWQLTTVDLDKPEDCRKKFISNQWLGLLIFLGIVAGRAYGEDNESAAPKPKPKPKLKPNPKPKKDE
mmetsp:Transcript_29551/g.51895  ORF Transcript_29551/g.51895 Transcript_29551/m.51895 type:complete len:197 (-) Transcript_29551:97-687(-)